MTSCSYVGDCGWRATREDAYAKRQKGRGKATDGGLEFPIYDVFFVR